MRLWLPVFGEAINSTFTNFDLKDLCWHNGDVMKIRPVVAAQHVLNC